MCGGWAIDLFVGRVTREHEDLEIAVFRHHQRALRALYAGWGQYKSIGGWAPWPEHEALELPIHQVLFRPPRSGPPPEPWEPAPDERQFFLDDVEDGRWICRRDPRLSRPVEELPLAARDGTPIVSPEVQLLYKAKHHQDKDEHDFRLALPRLAPERRAWLRDALELVHPGDSWLRDLT